MSTNKHKNGFTLIELLVVISIIAMLLSMILPSLSATKRYARSVICQSRLMEWGLFFTTYAEDYNDAFCKGPYSYTDTEGHHQNTQEDLWIYAMEGYYDNPEMLLCVAAERNDGASPFKRSWGNIDERPFYGSYGLNGWVYNPPVGVTEVSGHPTGNNWRSLNPKKRYNVPVLLDAGWHTGYPESSDLPASMVEYNTFIYEGDTDNQMRYFAIDRHDNGCVNVLFMDSSIEKVGLKELWRLKWHQNYDAGAELPEWPEWMNGIKNPK